MRGSWSFDLSPGALARRLLTMAWVMAWLIAAAVWPASAQAHKASDAYLVLERATDGQVQLRWDIALRDLDAVVVLDANDDGRITWGEVRTRQPQIQAYLMRQIGLRAAFSPAPCPWSPAWDGQVVQAPLETRVDGTYYVMRLSADCAAPDGRIQLRYGLLAQVDPTHRGLLKVGARSASVRSLNPNDAWVALQLGTTTPAAAVPVMSAAAAVAPARQGSPAVAEVNPTEPRANTTPWTMLRDGIHHILIGTDHVLFLLCLLLPAVLRPPAAGAPLQREPVAHWREALVPVVWTVSMFTVAHSITLVLASLQWVQISPRLIEPAIALTIALAAFDNLCPIFHRRRHRVTFVFGLIHGFGFAGVLSELSLPTSGFVRALLEFNLGVEIGQLMIVLPALLLLMAVRRWPAYARRIMPAISLAAIVVALGWFVERVFDLGFMPL